MNKAEQNIVNEEIAKTYELFNFQMSFQEYKDIFELGAKFGHSLAKIDLRNRATDTEVFEKPDVTVWELKREKAKSNNWFSKILK